MSSARIPVAGPWVTEHEVRYVAEAAANDWYGQAGQALRRFETAFAENTGVKHALAVPHCTAALHLAMLGLGLGEDDDVIVPEATWLATASPVSYVVRLRRVDRTCPDSANEGYHSRRPVWRPPGHAGNS
jgi:perosamine synthetase